MVRSQGSDLPPLHTVTTKAQFGRHLALARAARQAKQVAPIDKRGRRSLSKLSNWESGRNVPVSKEELEAYLRGLGIVDRESVDEWVSAWRTVKATIPIGRSVIGTQPLTSTDNGLLRVANSLRPDRVDAPAAGISNLPRSPSAVFVGRLQQIEKLGLGFVAGGDSNNNSRAWGQVILGGAGLGKTELALQYAERGRRKNNVVWWIPSDSANQIEAALAELAMSLLPPIRLAWKTVEAAAWAIQWFETHDRWIVVLDNADNPSVIQPLLGRLHRGNVIVTSRRNLSWRQWGLLELPLMPLSKTESMQLIHEYLRDNTHGLGMPLSPALSQDDPLHSQTHAAELANEMGGLPLGLRQASTYIRQQQIPISTYLERFHNDAFETLSLVSEGENRDHALSRAWQITFRTIQEEGQALDLLSALGWLGADNIPRGIVTGLGSGTAPHSGAVDRELGVLSSYSLIALTPTKVSMHRILQVVMRARSRELFLADRRSLHTPALAPGQETALRWLRMAIPMEPKSNISGWGLWRDLLPHITELVNELEPDLPNEEFAALCAETGSYFLVQGQPGEALPFKERALAATQKAFGPADVKTGVRLDNLASNLHALGYYTEALPLREQALAIVEAALGPHDPVTGIRVNNLAGTLQAVGRYREALVLRRRALEIAEAALGPDDPVTGRRLDNLAHTLNALGQYDEALPLAFRALAIMEAALGPDHPDVCWRLDSLGMTLQALGDHLRALDYQRRSVDISEAVLGSDHPELGKRLDSLAGTLRLLKRYEEAISLGERALRISESALGKEHPETVSRLHHLAESLHADGQIDRAGELKNQALGMTDRARGPIGSEQALNNKQPQTPSPRVGVDQPGGQLH
jgi:tetratricopeptide (TPR) repeat protein